MHTEIIITKLIFINRLQTFITNYKVTIIKLFLFILVFTLVLLF